MRRLLSIVLAVIMVASVAVLTVGAAQADTAGTGVDTATVTLTGIKGDAENKTYAVGDTVTAYVYLNTSGAGTSGIAALKGEQLYTSSVLELTDAYVTDKSSNDYGVVTATKSMFPVCNSGVVANAGETGAIYYNASMAAMKGFQFTSDSSALIVTNFKVKAKGNATISNSMTTLAMSDFALTRIIDKGTVKNDNFKSPVKLSEPTLPISSGNKVSGKITSFIDDTEEVSLTLRGSDNDAIFTAKGIASYEFAEVPAGKYVLSVSKTNHVTRDYDVTVSGEDVELDVKIQPIGDVTGDGKITNADYARVNQHVCKVKPLTDYALLVGNVVASPDVTNADLARINQAVCKVKPLW